jgi:hypothetical protein
VKKLSLILLACSAVLRADPLYTGRVRELGGSDPVAGATVEAVGLSRSVRADEQGRFQLALPGPWAQLSVSADGFDALQRKLTLSAKTRELPTFDLRRRVLQGQAVIIRARREAAPSRIPIKREEIRRIAGIGRDPLRALQTLPGVASPSDFSGLLAVRGGGPNDNAYFLNDIPFPLPFHYGGAISTVHSDLLEGVDLYPAAFPARWGGVDGAILDARSRRLKRDQLHGQADLNLLLAEGLFEGPLGRGASPSAAQATGLSGSAQGLSGTAQPESSLHGVHGGIGGGLSVRDVDLALPGQDLSHTAQALGATANPLGDAAQAPASSPVTAEATGAWLLSGRRSYFELLLSHLGDRFTAVPAFWDSSFLVEKDLGAHDSLRLTTLATDDVLGVVVKPEDARSADFAGEFRFHSWFQSLGLNWVHRGDGWRSTLTPYGYNNGTDQKFGDGYFVNIHPSDAGVHERLNLDLGAHELELGGEYDRLRFDVNGYAFRRRSGAGSGVITVSDPAGITVTAFSSNGAAYLQDRVALAPGLHLSAGLRWQKAEAMGLDGWDPRAALEWTPVPATRVSLGWGLFHQYPTPQELSADFGNPALGFNNTEHVTVGIEQGLGGADMVKVEAYYKTYRDRVVAVSDDRIYANDGEGYARGIELLLKHYGDGRWFGWLSYSYSESARLEKGDRWRPYQYDQPNNLNLLGSYSFTPAWSAGARLNWHSGPLITPIIDSTSYVDSGGVTRYTPVYGEPYSQRLDDYIRLDVRTDYAFRFHGWKLNLYAEVINLLGRPNPLGLEYTKDYKGSNTVNNLPLLPYIGLGAEF